MSTHCNIVIKTKDNKYKGVYCHFDGYPEGVGKTLKNNFCNEEMANKLIDLGNLSIVANAVRIDPIGQHSYSSPEKGTVVAYTRDRGEEWEDNKPMVNILISEFRESYIYLFEDNKWWLCNLKEFKRKEIQ
jgi:hypothetical protein